MTKRNLKSFKILSIFFLILFSCSTSKEKHLDGVWGIETITVNNKDITDQLYVNTLSFDSKTNKAWFHASVYFEKDSKAQWQILDNKYTDSITIKSTIPIYNNTFKIKISNRKNGQPRLELKSENVYINAYKLFK